MAISYERIINELRALNARLDPIDGGASATPVAAELTHDERVPIVRARDAENTRWATEAAKLRTAGEKARRTVEDLIAQAVTAGQNYNEAQLAYDRAEREHQSRVAPLEKQLIEGKPAFLADLMTQVETAQLRLLSSAPWNPADIESGSLSDTLDKFNALRGAVNDWAMSAEDEATLRGRFEARLKAIISTQPKKRPAQEPLVMAGPRERDDRFPVGHPFH